MLEEILSYSLIRESQIRGLDKESKMSVIYSELANKSLKNNKTEIFKNHYSFSVMSYKGNYVL